jgi:lipoteichoic acid synthase
MQHADSKLRPTPWHRSSVLAALALAGWLLALFWLRANLVDAAFSPYVRCDACFFWPSLIHDSVLLALALSALAVALWLRQRWLRFLVVLSIFALMLVAAADVLVFKVLTHRLLTADVFKFVKELTTVSDIGAQSLAGSARAIAITMLATGILVLVVCQRAGGGRRFAAVWLLSVALVIGVGGYAGRRFDPAYVNANVSFQNIVEVNLAQSIDAAYSPEFIAHMRAVPPLPQTCGAGQQRRPNVILVMVESLSAYHSRLNGGELDATPRLDALAARGRWFADFHANGFTTDGGMIALLGGLTPVPVIGRYSSMDAFAGYTDREHSVPALLARHGYYNAFFTTGDLGFVDKNRWLPAIGFDHFEGSESGFYAGRDRGIFGAARDALLFDRFVQWYGSERDAATPFFAALLTVTTHPPFVDPETGLADEEGVFREVDTAVAGLYAYLDERHFFDNGVLLVTGDHRAMTPIRPGEYQREGETAFSRVPMYAWGPQDLGRGRVDGIFQHSDLLPSLADLTGDSSCHHIGQGLFLRTEPRPAGFALHARGMPRDHIDVYSGNSAGAVVLAGDDSRWIGAKPAQWQSIEASIHLQRATRTGGEANLLDTMIELRKPQ